jgi:hypothetical protein
MKTTKKTFARAAQALSLVVMAAAVVALSNCKKDDNGGNGGDPDLPDLELEVEPATSYFTYAAGTADIEVYCNDAWTATVDAAAAAWCSVSPASGDGEGFVAITVTNNTVPPGSTRAATVTFTSGDLTQTVAVTQEVIPTAFCEKCLWDDAKDEGEEWVDGYITSTFYPYDEATTHIGTNLWSGNGDTYYEGAVSSVNGRANTAAIPSTAGSIVQRCKDLGAGWYLPAYEEYYNMSSADADGGRITKADPLNGLSGANLLTIVAEDKFHYSSTEAYNNGGRCTSADEGDKNKLVMVSPSGYTLPAEKGWNGNARCAWLNPGN